MLSAPSGLKRALAACGLLRDCSRPWRDPGASVGLCGAMRCPVGFGDCRSPSDTGVRTREIHTPLCRISHAGFLLKMIERFRHWRWQERAYEPLRDFTTNTRDPVTHWRQQQIRVHLSSLWRALDAPRAPWGYTETCSQKHHYPVHGRLEIGITEIPLQRLLYFYL